MKAKSLIFYYHPDPPTSTTRQYSAVFALADHHFMCGWVRAEPSRFSYLEAPDKAKPRPGEIVLNSVDLA